MKDESLNFSEFEAVSAKQWKQKIQMELKGLDYNDTLVWESLEGIKVKPFYDAEDLQDTYQITVKEKAFQIRETIYVKEVTISNANAKEKLSNGTQIIRFIIPNQEVSLNDLFHEITNQTIVVKPFFLDASFFENCVRIAKKQNIFISFEMDAIGQLMEDGNWFANQKQDFDALEKISSLVNSPFLCIQNRLLQNAGANCIQQIAYGILHLALYWEKGISLHQNITWEVGIGSNYFFEIAKLRSIRLLFENTKALYGASANLQLVAIPSTRNKTIYDYNVNMLRTTNECMSAIIGGAHVVENLPYDAIYHKNNAFGDRIARNQLLIMKHEAYLDQNFNGADGSYFIENITKQMIDKSIELVHKIDAEGGLISQLIEGTIQRKIKESADKEQEWLDTGKLVLIGTTKYPNPKDQMKNDLELYPFVKQNPRKTLVVPIIPRRLAEAIEQNRLEKENTTNA
jgi:methylmalonyl-CoA mutase